MSEKHFGTYHTALSKAWNDFAGVEIESAPERCLCEVSDGEIRVDFFNLKCAINPRERTVRYADGTEPPGPITLIVLHYVIGAKPLGPTGKLLPYRALPNGAPFAGPFRERSIGPLARVFGAEPEKLIEAGAQLGGRRAPHGDASVEAPFLPRLPVTCLVWAGDDEFPAEANILFDSSAVNHFHIEDLAVVGEITTRFLIRAAGAEDAGLGIIHDTKPG